MNVQTLVALFMRKLCVCNETFRCSQGVLKIDDYSKFI